MTTEKNSATPSDYAQAAPRGTCGCSAVLRFLASSVEIIGDGQVIRAIAERNEPAGAEHVAIEGDRPTGGSGSMPTAIPETAPPSPIRH